MSSDQQLNVHISAVNDLCHTKQNDSQYHEKCSEDNVITANVILENEAVKNCSDTNNGNGKTLEVNEPPANEENVPSLEELTSEIGTVPSYEKFPCEDNNDVETDHRISENACNISPTGLNENVTTNPLNEENINSCPSNGLLTESPNEQNLSPCMEDPDEQRPDNGEINDETQVVDVSDKPVEFMNGSNADDDEFEENNEHDDDDVSNDGDDNFSNEHDSNEDRSDAEHSDGEIEVENDEYILDTVLRKPRKERRRIVSVNDDSDPEMDEERERLLRSPTLDESQTNDIADDDDIAHLLIGNEKPGPKSKKFSTQKLKEIQARELLRNAVVIPSTSKKKKRRVIDSEDEEEPLPYSVDVDDIGLPDTMEENENENDSDALLSSSILLNDLNDFDKPDVASMENIMPSCSLNVDDVHESTIKSEPVDTKPVVSQCIPESDIKCSSEISQERIDQSPEAVPSVKQESFNVTENETGMLCDSGNSTDSANQQNRVEMEIANTDFPPFSSSSSSDTEDEFIPNEIYFGTPDQNKRKSSRGRAQRPRGRAVPSSTRGVKTVSNASRSTKAGRAGGRPSRRDNFIDNRRISSTSGSISGASSSDSEDEYRNSKARRKKPATVTIVKQPLQLYQKGRLPVRPIQKQQQVEQIPRQNVQKRDRFYDKSQDIPNAVYFGDVDVPLHVLHSYGDSDSDNDRRNTKTGNRFVDQVQPGRPNTLQKQSGQLQRNHQQTTIRQVSNSQKARGRTKTKASNSLSPSNDRSIQMMKKYLKAAGLKRVKLNRLWEGCKSNSERAEKMLELLREKGLEGEPSIAKCKQLKVDYLTKREIEDLDPNLIIQTEGRTTRRSTRAATKRQYTYDDEEILETRTKLKKVIDSDSDFE